MVFGELFGKCDSWFCFSVFMLIGGWFYIGVWFMPAWNHPDWLFNTCCIKHTAVVIRTLVDYTGKLICLKKLVKACWRCFRDLILVFTECLKTVDIYYIYTHFSTQDCQLLSSLTYIISIIKTNNSHRPPIYKIHTTEDNW